MRCPPVSLIIGMRCLSATSAMRRSWSAEVTPPFICGTTENVPSRWMLACTRSLMKRPSRSSTTSAPQIVRSSEVSPIFDRASSTPPGASAANTADTERRSRSRTSATSSALA